MWAFSIRWLRRAAIAVGLSQVRSPAIVMHRVAPCVLNAWRGARLVERHVVEAVRTLGATACA